VEYQFSGEKVKDQGQRTKKHANWCHVHLRAADQAKADSALTAKRAYAIVRPNLLSVPEHETLDNWSNGRMSCPISAPICFLATIKISALLLEYDPIIRLY